MRLAAALVTLAADGPAQLQGPVGHPQAGGRGRDASPLLDGDLLGDVFRRAADRFPRVAEAHYFVGLALRAKGDYAAAASALRPFVKWPVMNRS